MDEDRTREELLYLARLAEQCDRFDGKYYFNFHYTSLLHKLIACCVFKNKDDFTL